jgi:hypothetical protein
MSRSAESDPLERACSLVGRFMYHFSRVEKKIDQAIIKLSDFDERVAPIVAMIEFARKVDFVQASAYAQVKSATDKQFAKDTCGRVHSSNRNRNMIPHSSFEPVPGGGVQFGRTLTKDGRFHPVDPPWTDADFTERYAEMSVLETELDKLIELIKPVPDIPWQQEMYRDTPLTLRVAASILAKREAEEFAS